MEKFKGTSRTAYVGESLTIKIPNFNIKRAISTLIRASRNGIAGIREYITGKEGNPSSISFSLLRGIRENIRERVLSKTELDFLVPTRLSILGLINFQDTATATDSKDDEIYEAFFRKLTQLPNFKDEDEKMLRAGGHTLPQAKNYGIHDGKVKLLDYGEVGLDKLLAKYGYLLQQVLEESQK